VKVPILANITEFGRTPLFTVDELRSADVAMVLYPLTAFRAMNKAALKVYETVRKAGTQKPVLAEMQTREDLYDIIGYHDYEKKLDELFARATVSGLLAPAGPPSSSSAREIDEQFKLRGTESD